LLYTAATTLLRNRYLLNTGPTGSASQHDVSNWVLTRVDTKGPVWQGGSPDARLVRVTEGDVARVAQLYPKADGSSYEAMTLDKWGTAKGGGFM
jgi:hypothetical protein